MNNINKLYVKLVYYTYQYTIHVNRKFVIYIYIYI